MTILLIILSVFGFAVLIGGVIYQNREDLAKTKGKILLSKGNK